MLKPVLAAACLLECLLPGSARANVIYGLWPQAIGAVEHAPASPDLVPSCLFPKGLCGYKAPDGATVIEGRFDWADAFQDGVAAVALARRWGFIDPTGAFVIPPRFRAVSRFRHGLAEAMPEAVGPRGVIDQTGAWVLPPEHCWVRAVSASHIWTQDSPKDCRQIEDINPEERRAGLLWDFPLRSLQPITVRDRQGRAVGRVAGMPQRWFGPDAVIVQEYEVGNIQQWVKSANGANLTDRSYFGISSLSEGLAEVVTTRLAATGFIGSDGKLAIPLQLGFQNSLPRGFRGGRAFAAEQGSKNGSGIGIIDRSGTFVIAPRERQFERTFDGPYCFFPPGLDLNARYRWGLKSEDGQMLIPPTFAHACYFDIHGRSCVDINDLYGIVDRTGSYTVPLGPAPIAPFDLANGTYWRSEGDKWGLIDGGGRWLVEPKLDAAAHLRGALKPGYRPYSSVNGLGRVGREPFDRSEPTSSGRSRVSAIAVLDGKAGVLDGLGRWLIAPTHDELRGTERIGYTNGLIPARRGELWGYVDMTGAFVIEPRYADAGFFTNERARVLERLPGRLNRIVVIDRRGNEIAARVTSEGLVVGPGPYGGWQSDHGCGW